MPVRRAAAEVHAARVPVSSYAAVRHGACSVAGMRYEASGERRLMLAVLEDAIRTLLLARRTALPRKRLVSELAWLESRSRAEPFAFESICDVLGIDAGWLRGRLATGTFVPQRTRGRGPRTTIRRMPVARGRSCSAWS